MILYYRNDEKLKSRRFLLLDSSLYDKHNIDTQEFISRSKAYATSWGYTIESNEKEYNEYTDEDVRTLS